VEHAVRLALVIEHAKSFEVRSADGQTLRRFPFDEAGTRYLGMKKKQAGGSRVCGERRGFDSSRR
jgi:hypothetical protein